MSQSGKNAERKRLELSGEVDSWGSRGLTNVSPTIGGVHVIDKLFETFDLRTPLEREQVTVYLGVEPLKTGPLWAAGGFGGTDVTPPESPEIKVGDLDLVDKAGRPGRPRGSARD